jgi:rhomboid protease GluP
MDIRTTIRKLVALNLAIYLLQTMFSSNEFFYYFGLNPFLIVHEKQPWRLLSYSFLHKDFINLFLNMVVLPFLGDPLEKIIGSRKILIVYLLSALSGGVIVTIRFFEMPVVYISSTASVFGIMLAHSIYLPNRILFWNWLKIRDIIWFMGFLTIVSLASEGGYWPSLGGIVFGAVFSLIDKRFSKQQSNDSVCLAASKSTESPDSMRMIE